MANITLVGGKSIKNFWQILAQCRAEIHRLPFSLNVIKCELWNKWNKEYYVNLIVLFTFESNGTRLKYLPIWQNEPIRQGSGSTSKFYILRKFFGGLNALCTFKKFGEGETFFILPILIQVSSSIWNVVLECFPSLFYHHPLWCTIVTGRTKNPTFLWASFSKWPHLLAANDLKEQRNWICQKFLMDFPPTRVIFATADFH